MPTNSFSGGIMGYPVTHFQFDSKDDVATADFYCKLFDWKSEPVPNMNYHTIATGSKDGIQGGIGKVQDGQPSGLTFYIEVPSVAEALQKAESMGAKVIQPATQVMPELTLGMFVDLEGRNVGLSTMLKPPVKEVKVKAAPKKKAASKAKGKAAKKAKKKRK